MSEVSGRSVVITGANRGIGRALAQRFVALGDSVATIYRGGELPEGVYGALGDVRSTDSVNDAMAQIEAHQGPAQVVIANAGVTRDGLLMRMSDEDWDTVLDTNLKGAFRLARRACKPMIKARGGRLIFISSVVALYGGPGQVNYSSSKAALVGMARSITRELGGRGITANVIAPGFIDTDMTAALPEARRKQYLATIPAGRFGAVDDIAATAEFLASPGAAYISGAVVPVDGGLGMGH